MTMSVRFCLSNNPLDLDVIAFKMNKLPIRKHTVDMDLVNDITYSCQSVTTPVVIQFL